LVPEAAIQQQDGHAVVLVVHNGRAERRAVTVSSSINGEITISAGVSAGERIVVDRPPGLSDGAAVKEAESH
jgi:hypothetical protein